jgi:flagellar biogenesis protein FliO
MSFPISPSNNQIALVNGIEYYYLATKGAWYRYGDGSANVITSNTFQVLSSILFSDGTSQATAANPTDSFARTTANNATNNIVILQGVNVDQNTRITISEGVDVGQNTRMSIIEGVDTTQNTNITIATNAATAAFAQANATAGGLTTANSRITIAEGVDLAQNTRMDIIEGVNTTQNTRITISEGVDVGQNTRMDIIEGVDATQNTNITNVDTKAQAAFNRANDAFTLANTANAAASSGGGSLTSFTTTVDTFAGNGSQTTFNLSVTPDSENSTFVFLNGVYQEKSTYSVSGSSLILTDVATANDDIEVTTVSGSIMNVSPSAYSTRIYQGDGLTDTFTISSGHNANTIMVFNNGVCQFPVDDYTVSGTTLTYVLTPESDETIQIRELPINKLVPLTYQMRRYTANGVQTQFTVTAGQTANSMFVYENGICQVPILDYTVSGDTLTFVTAPVNNVIIQIREASI